MTTTFRFDSVLVADGWIAPGWVTVADDGMIVDVGDAAPPDGLVEAVSGHAVPGLANLSAIAA